jgi:hypothetical protein
MASDISEITVNYEEDGVLVVKELEKEILTKGTWTTIMFKYQQWDKNKNDYGAILFTIRRYQKRNDEYWQRSKFNISSKEQAQKIIEVLQRWTSEQAASPS